MYTCNNKYTLILVSFLFCSCIKLTNELGCIEPILTVKNFNNKLILNPSNKKDFSIGDKLHIKLVIDSEAIDGNNKIDIFKLTNENKAIINDIFHNQTNGDINRLLNCSTTHNVRFIKGGLTQGVGVFLNYDKEINSYVLEFDVEFLTKEIFEVDDFDVQLKLGKYPGYTKGRDCKFYILNAVLDLDNNFVIDVN